MDCSSIPFVSSIEMNHLDDPDGLFINFSLIAKSGFNLLPFINSDTNPLFYSRGKPSAIVLPDFPGNFSFDCLVSELSAMGAIYLDRLHQSLLQFS